MNYLKAYPKRCYLLWKVSTPIIKRNIFHTFFTDIIFIIKLKLKGEGMRMFKIYKFLIKSLPKLDNVETYYSVPTNNEMIP